MKKDVTPRAQANRLKTAFLPRIGRFFAGIGKFITSLPGKLYHTALHDLDNPDVFRRMGAAAIWMAALFIVSWLFSFLVFKEGMLSKTWLVDKFFGVKAPDKWAYWPKVFLVAGKIFLHYLLVMIVFIFLLNHFRVGPINLGHVFLLAYTILIGVVAGTNSWTEFYAKTKLAALITFARFSLWQLLAFMLAVVGTTGLAAFATQGWFKGTWERIRPLHKPQFKGEDLEVLLYSVLILIAASIAEARLVVFYKLHF